MPKFITLTPTNSNEINKILLNINAIESILDYGDCTHITIIGTGNWLEVKESPESVINLIKREEKDDAAD